MSTLPARGELWWAEVPDRGRRPVLVLSRDESISRLRRPLVAPLTTNARGLVTEVSLERGDDPVPRTSVVSLDSVESISVGVLVERLGRLSDVRMREVCTALGIATGC